VDVTTTNELSPAEQLTAMFDLESVGVTVIGARIVGVDSRATADLYLSDGTVIVFESLRDFATPARLTLELALATGATPQIKPQQAIRAVALLGALAERHRGATLDEISVEWGQTFLQSAETLDVDIADGGDRWAAFQHLEKVDPYGRARQENITIAQASVVLLNVDGTRFVRAGWFRQFVKGEDPGTSIRDIPMRMERVGWRRRNSRGQIKATAPGRRAELGWPFYVVPAGWEQLTSAAPEGNE
jgi:hypothetical protein